MTCDDFWIHHLISFYKFRVSTNFCVYTVCVCACNPADACKSTTKGVNICLISMSTRKRKTDLWIICRISQCLFMPYELTNAAHSRRKWKVNGKLIWLGGWGGGEHVHGVRGVNPSCSSWFTASSEVCTDKHHCKLQGFNYHFNYQALEMLLAENCSIFAPTFRKQV